MSFSTGRGGRLYLFAFVVMFCAFVFEVEAQTTNLPRVQAADLEYLGAFALPSGDYGVTRFGYGGRAVTPYHDSVTGKATLFIEGHAWEPGSVAQVEIPSSISKSIVYGELPVASVLQNFFDITDGKLATTGASDYNALFGMLPYNGRLIVAATSWYDAPCAQNASHGVSTFNLAETTDFAGFRTITATANARSLGGYMTIIPNEWRALFGGPALTGNSALSIISCISSGPAATVFDPAQIEVQPAVHGTTVIYYPLNHYLVSGGMSSENTFSFGSSVKGIAFPAGSRSVLFFGVQTFADGYCYGPGTTDPALHRVPTAGGTWCYDLCNSSKGGHGYPYHHYVWAYDANELLQVKAGQKQSWEVLPYAAWRINDLNSSGCSTMVGAGYDPMTRRVFITQSYGEQPKIDVFSIRATSAAPAAPGALRVE